MPTKLQTLIVLIPGFPSDEDDTTCLPAQQNFIKCLNRLYPTISVIVVSLQYPHRRNSYTWHGNKVVALGGKNRRGLNKLLLRMRARKILESLASSESLLGILSFWCGECALIGERFARKNKLSHFCWLMGQDAKADNIYVKRLDKNPESFIAISDSIQRIFSNAHGFSPAHVIPLGIDKTDPVENTGRDIDLLCAGSLTPLKRFDFAIEVAKQLKKDYPKLKLSICGDGPERAGLQDLIILLGLENNVTLKGELSHPQVLQTMHRAKILLHPSSYEGFSGVCLEALSAGMQVISFCQPMQGAIPNWHIVRSKEEMWEKAKELLERNIPAEYTIPYKMKDSVHRLMSLLK